MNYFPVFFNLAGARVLVVGGGEVALRKVTLLERTGALITLVAPEIRPELQARTALSLRAREFEPADLEGMRLVIVATSRRAINRWIASLCEAQAIPVNVVDDKEASRFIDAYFDRYEGVRTYMDETIKRARQGEAVRTLLGRRRFLPNLHSANRGLRAEAERLAKNTPIQGTAADLMKVAMVKLVKDGVLTKLPGVKMILTVHDELVFEVPLGMEKEAGDAIRATMSGAMKLDVPLVVDVGWGPNWAAAH